MDSVEPLLPPETDCRDIDGFLLNVEKLMASELWALATAEELRAALALWCRAWKQVPAASLPDDDRVLAAFSGAGARWPKLREMALRSFIKCNDGRLYHPVLAAEAVKAYEAKVKSRKARDVSWGAWLSLRRWVFTRDNWTCQYCGEHGGRLECDHVVPFSRGGPSVASNLKTACHSCNRAKGAKTIEEWLGHE